MEFWDKEDLIIRRPSSHGYSEHKDTDFLATVEEIDVGIIPRSEMVKVTATMNLHIDWKDIHLTWELRRKSDLKRPAEREWTVESAVGKPKPQPDFKHATKAAASTSKKVSKKPQAKGGPNKERVKRKRIDDDAGNDKKDRPTKKSRCDSSESVYNNDPPPDVQCAYYGAERLAALFGTTHNIVILLTGKSTLRLRRRFLTCGY